MYFGFICAESVRFILSSNSKANKRQKATKHNFIHRLAAIFYDFD